VKKIFLTIIVLLTAAFVISACSQARTPAPTATPETMAKTDEAMQKEDAMKSDEAMDKKEDMAKEADMKKDDSMAKEEEMMKEESMDKDDAMQKEETMSDESMKKEDGMDHQDGDMSKDGDMNKDGEMSGEASMKDDAMMEKALLTLTFQGLENLGEGWAYEGWLIVDGKPVTTGVFTVDDKGMASATEFQVDAHALKNATAFVLTIEPSPDSDPAPSNVHILGGDFDGDSASLATAHPLALGVDFSDVTGSYILGAPSSKMAAEEYRQGIWWPALSLPTLPEGWIYEGWVVGPDGPISTGRFASGDMADSDGNGPTAGPNPGPAFPGQDFIDPAIDLTSGYAAVISIEPNPDTSPGPFLLKPLVDKTIEDVGDHGSQDMMNQAATFPTGAATR